LAALRGAEGTETNRPDSLSKQGEVRSFFALGFRRNYSCKRPTTERRYEDMTASSNEERLAQIETRLEYLSELVEDIHKSMHSGRYMTADMCELQHKVYNERFANMENRIERMEQKQEEMRKTWAHRLWALATPLVVAFVASLVALIFEFKQIMK
jgi:hypothetical protein